MDEDINNIGNDQKDLKKILIHQILRKHFLIIELKLYHLLLRV